MSNHEETSHLSYANDRASYTRGASIQRQYAMSEDLPEDDTEQCEAPNGRPYPEDNLGEYSSYNGTQHATPEDSSGVVQEPSLHHLPPSVARSNSLTIQDQWIQDDILQEDEYNMTEGKSCLPVFAKWLVMIISSLIFLSCLVLSKLSLVDIGKYFLALRINQTHDIGPGVNTSSDFSTIPDYGIESTFLWLVISLMVPYGTTLLRSLWCGAFRQDRPWPSKTALAWVCTSNI